MEKFLHSTKINQFIKRFVTILHVQSSFSNAIIGIVEINSTRHLVKITPYHIRDSERFGQSNGLLDEVDAESQIITILHREFDTSTPCIVHLTHVVYRDDLREFIKDVDCVKMSRSAMHTVTRTASVVVKSEMCNWAAGISTGYNKDKFAIQTMEICESSLSDFLYHYQGSAGDFMQLKAIIFHIIWFLWTITRKYPGFRHNDLHSGNVLFKADDSFTLQWKNPKFIEYVTSEVSPVNGSASKEDKRGDAKSSKHSNGDAKSSNDKGDVPTSSVKTTKFYVPYFGYVPRVIDYGFSTLPEKHVTSVMTKNNEVFHLKHGNDLATLFMHIYSGKAAAYEATIKLLSAIDPSRNFELSGYMGKTLIDKMPSYEAMIANPIWRDYNQDIPRSAVYKTYTV